MMKKFFLLISVAAAVLIAPRVQAGACNCTASTLSVAGGYSVFSGGAWQPTATFTIQCNGNASYNVAVGPGYSGTYSNRTMLQGGTGAALNYNIYTDAARSVVWGTTNVLAYSTSSGQTTFSQPLYFSFPASQDVPYSGTVYWDVVQVTMTPQPGTGGGTNSCNLQVQSSVTAECNAPAAALSFGVYDPVSVHASAPLDVSSTLSYYCTKGVAATITLDNGQNFNVTRRMAGPPSNFLSYDIFTTTARSTIWSSLNTVVTLPSSSKNAPLTVSGGTPLTAFGRIPGGQDVVKGSYSDSVTATLNY